MRMMQMPVSVSPASSALDRRRAAPARQQRGVDVDAAQSGYRQHRRRQDQAVGGHHQQIRRQGGQLGLNTRDRAS
jgi:hypothetical protein